MVRVVSQSFSHPRSRHSSGETDLDLALRADSALSTLQAKRIDLAECESSSDSFWDSEFDTDQHDHQFCPDGFAEDQLNGNESPEKSDVYSKRKERRRERNKVSAQAYRQRRRQVNVTAQQELTILEEKNKDLKTQVRDLEQKTEQAKQFLKGQSVSVPDFLCPTKAHDVSFSTSSISNEVEKSKSIINQSLSPACPRLTGNNMNINSQSWEVGSFADKRYQHPNHFSVSSGNANIPNVVANTNLNTLADTSMAVCNASGLASLPSDVGLLSAKPKQNHVNANHFYKIPIHHPKMLRTVHEIPSPSSNDEDDSKLLFTNHFHDSPKSGKEGAKASCDTFGALNDNMNINANLNERINKCNTLHNKDEKIWNETFHMNPLKAVNMNDNENSTLSKPHLQNSPPLLLHSDSFIRVIISSGENRMPPQ